jgi:hypothetical protein
MKEDASIAFHSGFDSAFIPDSAGELPERRKLRRATRIKPPASGIRRQDRSAAPQQR